MIEHAPRAHAGGRVFNQLLADRIAGPPRGQRRRHGIKRFQRGDAFLLALARERDQRAGSDRDHEQDGGGDDGEAEEEGSNEHASESRRRYCAHFRDGAVSGVAVAVTVS